MPRSPRLSVLLPLVAALAGCSTAGRVTSLAPQTATSGLHGSLHGGQQPIVGATIQLYAVGTAGDGSAGTPLLTPAILTDATGSFDLTGKFTCPQATTLVYIVATGGNPGLPPPFNNPASTLISALGPCGNPNNINFISLNEVSTVAAVYALAPFMSSPTAIGSGASDAQALADAFTLAMEFVNPVTGTSPGASVPPGTTIPVAQINTLANLISACVNSGGGTAGDSTICGQIFSLTQGSGAAPTDTTTALLHLALNPGLNTQALYDLVLPTAPFQPTITQQPPDFGVRPTVPSDFTVSPGSLDFGSIFVGGTTASQTITITNNTTYAYAIPSFTLMGANSTDFTATFQPGTSCTTALYMLPGTNCQVLVTFNATAVGGRQAYLVIRSNSPNAFIPVALSGTGTADTNPGPITVSPSSLNFTLFGVSQPVTLTNLGNTPLSMGDITISPSPRSGSPYTQTNNCGSSLQPQSICTINVTAHSANTQNATMTIHDDAAAGPQTVALSYTGSGAGLIDNVDFVEESVGSTGTMTISFPPSAFNSQLTLTGTNAADFSASSPQCDPRVLLCSIDIKFTPTALGQRTAALVVPDIGNISLTGMGIGPGLVFEVPSSLSFLYSAGGPNQYNFRVRYTGTLDTYLSPTVVAGTHNSEFTTASYCDFSDETNRFCNMVVTFTPAANTGFSGSILVSDSNNTVQKSIPFTASTLNGTISTSATALTFPSTLAGTISAPQSVTVTAVSGNPVKAAIVAPGLNYPLGSFQIIQGATCSTTPCQVTVVFDPSSSAAAGQQSATLAFSDPLTNTYGIVSLFGTVDTQTTASVSPGSLTFPSRAVNSTSIPQTITVTNTGATNVLTFSSVTLTGANPGDYTLTNNCTTNVVPGNSCTINVSFSPTASGSRTANVQIVSNSTTSPDIVTLSGTAQ